MKMGSIQTWKQRRKEQGNWEWDKEQRDDVWKYQEVKCLGLAVEQSWERCQYSWSKETPA